VFGGSHLASPFDCLFSRWWFSHRECMVFMQRPFQASNLVHCSIGLVFASTETRGIASDVMIAIGELFVSFIVLSWPLTRHVVPPSAAVIFGSQLARSIVPSFRSFIVLINNTGPLGRLSILEAEVLRLSRRHLSIDHGCYDDHPGAGHSGSSTAINFDRPLKL
jgi:hypothetical protein